MYKYFTGIKTVEKLRKKYRELLKQHHPDNGGNEEIMKEINLEYDSLFADLSRENSSSEECSSEHEKEENEAFKNILNQIIGYNMEIEIIGKWIWCFDCYAYKDKLKELGFKWAAKKKAWTWHHGNYKRYHKGEMSLDDIRSKYGAQKVNRKSKQFALD